MQDPFFRIDNAPRTARSLIKRTSIVLFILAFLFVLVLPKFKSLEEFMVDECKYWTSQGSLHSSAPGNFIEGEGCYSASPDCSLKEKKYMDNIRKKCNEVLNNSTL